jgi:hypothetical protein
LKDLKTLSINDTNITDDGLSQLKNLRKLEVLFLDGTAITDTGIKELAGLTELRRLFAKGTAITDVSIEAVRSNHEKLESLQVANTKITDQAIAHLERMPHLFYVSLDETAVLVWGEFGRTPTINESAGRDHWPNVRPGDAEARNIMPLPNNFRTIYCQPFIRVCRSTSTKRVTRSEWDCTQKT